MAIFPGAGGAPPPPPPPPQATKKNAPTPRKGDNPNQGSGCGRWRVYAMGHHYLPQRPMIERRRPIGPTPPMTMRGRQSGSTGATGSDRPSRPTARFDRRQRNTQLRLIGQPPVPQLHSLQFACGLTLASASAATTAAPPKREAGRVPAAGSLPLLPRQRPSGHHGRHCRATPRQPSSQQNSPMRRTEA